MRTHSQRHAGTRRHVIRKAPPAVLHSPWPGEDIELFSDRLEDAVEYDEILHDFSLLHDAEVAADRYDS